MRCLLAALLLSSCTVSTRFHDPTWPDTPALVRSIRCAVEAVHGTETASVVMLARVQAVSGMQIRGRYNHRSGLIALSDSAPSAKASALRHEVFAHRVPHVVKGDHNPWDAAWWAPSLARLQSAWRVCWGRVREWRSGSTTPTDDPGKHTKK